MQDWKSRQHTVDINNRNKMVGGIDVFALTWSREQPFISRTNGDAFLLVNNSSISSRLPKDTARKIASSVSRTQYTRRLNGMLVLRFLKMNSQFFKRKSLGALWTFWWCWFVIFVIRSVCSSSTTESLMVSALLKCNGDSVRNPWVVFDLNIASLSIEKLVLSWNNMDRSSWASWAAQIFKLEQD